MNFSRVEDAWKTPKFATSNNFNPKDLVKDTLISEEETENLFNSVSETPNNNNLESFNNKCPHCLKNLHTTNLKISNQNIFYEVILKYFIHPFTLLTRLQKELIVLAIILFLIVLIIKLLFSI